jgi:hypothetical protein
VLEQVGLWEGCVGTSRILAVWEQVGLREGCVGTSGNVSCTVREQVGLWEGCVGTSGNMSTRSVLCGNMWDCGKAAWELVGI